MNTKSFLDSATDYIQNLNWHILPIHTMRNGKCSCGKNCGKSAGKHPRTSHGFKDASNDVAQIEKWNASFGSDTNVAVATEASELFVFDVDIDKGGYESLADLLSLDNALPLTPMQKTGGGGKQYFFKRPKDGAPSSVGFLPGLDIRCDGAYACLPPSLHKSGKRYEWEPGLSPFDVELAEAPGWLVECARSAKQKQNELNKKSADGDLILEGRRNATLTSHAGSLYRNGSSKEEVLEKLLAVNKKSCMPPLDKSEVEQIVNSVERYHSAAMRPKQEEPKKPILSKKAFYGLVGRIVQAIAPHTEASVPALLVQLLVGFGNMIGRTAYTQVEADRHHGNLFAIITGLSSKARKGTSWGHIIRLLKMVEADWATENNNTGLSSGEGLIWSVRDPIFKTERSDDGVYEEVCVDEGIEDKRLNIVESEFVSALKVSAREGNTLSATVRNAWDGKDLSIMNKNSPAKATAPHVSITGHITISELLRYLTNTEVGNGFGNRFLFVYSERSKELPDGGNIESVDFSAYIQELKDAKVFAETCGRLNRDEEAKLYWRSIYSKLSADRPGLYGSLVARAESQVLRLSGLFAVLDQSNLIKKCHLEAALAVWNYCEESVSYIFGDALGDPMADEILAALRANPSGLSRTNIRDLFKRNKNADDVSRALLVLVKNSLANFKTIESGGRPTEMWFATSQRTTETTKGVFTEV